VVGRRGRRSSLRPLDIRPPGRRSAPAPGSVGGVAGRTRTPGAGPRGQGRRRVARRSADPRRGRTAAATSRRRRAAPGVRSTPSTSG
jgi:hypothetical protein